MAILVTFPYQRFMERDQIRKMLDLCLDPILLRVVQQPLGIEHHNIVVEVLAIPSIE